jgi:chorismate-pyruvate lyase
MTPDPKLFYPLNEFYEHEGLTLPRFVRVEGRDVPEPYKSLLVHENDVTPTLAAAYGRKIQLRILRKRRRHDVFSREIILEPEGDGRKILFGAIKIYLERFTPEARQLILECKQPFGTILQEQGIVHSSRPEAYIQVEADEVINEALGLTGHAVLYGRRSALWNASQRALAQVLEILPSSTK